MSDYKVLRVENGWILEARGRDDMMLGGKMWICANPKDIGDTIQANWDEASKKANPPMEVKDGVVGEYSGALGKLKWHGVDDIEKTG